MKRMPLKNKIVTVLAIVFGALGIYLVLSSDRIQMDPFNIVIFLLAGRVIVYLYLLYFRTRYPGYYYFTVNSYLSM